MLKKPALLLLWLAPTLGWGLTPSGIGLSPANEKKAHQQVQQADSLFARGQYAAAAPRYQAIVRELHQASPQLLLKLAYAQQQQGDDAAALRSLSLAQARQPRLATWRQLAALAARQRLVGYPTTWQQELRVRGQRYYYPGLQALLILAVLGAGLLILRRRRTQRNTWLLYGAYLGLVSLYLHWLRPAPAALVLKPGAVLMAGPGAGAAWLSTAAVGDRLLVLDRHDIWYQVRWQQRTAFIRANDLLVMEQ